MIHLDNGPSESAPGCEERLKSCGSNESPVGRERGCWDELMRDGEFFEDDDLWLADDLKNC
jgi:hypothetical protein